MIGLILSVVLVVAAAEGALRNFKGVDPNTLSCDPLGQVSLLLPHYEECNKYYMCAHGREVEFTCPSTLIFDFELQTCNWRWATQCYLRTKDTGDNGDGDEIEDGSGFTDDGEMVTDFPSLIPVQNGLFPLNPLSGIGPNSDEIFKSSLNCDKAESSARQIAYKGNCQRYWKCISGVPQAVYCNDGLFFNQITEQCDFETNVKCTDNSEAELELDGEFMLYK